MCSTYNCITRDGIMGESILAISFGCAIGLILGVSGAGGGILAVPLLCFGLGLGVSEAAPIALFAVGISAAFGAALGLKAGTVRYRAAAVIAVGGMLTAPIGIWISQRIANQPLLILFGVILAWVATASFAQSRVELTVGQEEPHKSQRPPCEISTESGQFRWTLKCFGRMITCGAVMGLLSGLIGVGGGFIVVPFFRRFSNLKTNAIVVTSLAIIALVSATTVTAATFSGLIRWQIAIPFSVGSVLGLLTGNLVAKALPRPRVHQIFSVVAGIGSFAMLVKGIGGFH